MSDVKKGKKVSAETRSKMSLSKIGKKNSFFGKKHTEEMKRQLSKNLSGRFAGKNNPFFGRHHTKETIFRISKSKAESIANGDINPIRQSRRGWHKGVYYHSFYELARMKQLRRDPQVRSVKRNQIVIIYYFENQKRCYIPDFLIEYVNGKIFIEEVKGYECDKDRAKYAAAIRYCSDMKIRFRVIYKHHIFKDNAEYRKFLSKNSYDK